MLLEKRRGRWITARKRSPKRSSIELEQHFLSKEMAGPTKVCLILRISIRGNRRMSKQIQEMFQELLI